MRSVLLALAVLVAAPGVQAQTDSAPALGVHAQNISLPAPAVLAQTTSPPASSTSSRPRPRGATAPCPNPNFSKLPPNSRPKWRIRWISDPAKRKMDCQSSPTAKTRTSGCWAFSAFTSRARLCEMSWNSSTRMWRNGLT